ncbi:MAG: hypothetical protein M3Q60_18530 [Actinomycetota bacterium]|nr:hypothetical protein [Actinomycetota bacterium]
MRFSQKFERFLEEYRRPDGRRWTGQDLHDATHGFVTRSYVSTLRKGTIKNPGVEKLRAIARAMGFPPELWFEEEPRVRVPGPAAAPGERWDIADRLDHLLRTLPEETTGEPLTDEAVARMSLGDLTAADVEGIRTRRLPNPTVAQVVALAAVFGVAPSYFLDDASKKPPRLDDAAIRVLSDDKSVRLAAKSLGLSDEAKDLVLDLIERLGGGDGEDEENATP